LGVDPMHSEYASHSTYSYCANLPIIFTDTNGEVIVDPATGDPVVITYLPHPSDANKVSVTFLRESGEPVSSEFTRGAGVILTNLGQSTAGRNLIHNMMNLGTDITLEFPSEELKYKGHSSGISPETNSNGEMKMDKSTGLFEAVTITPNMKIISEQAEANGISKDEAFVGVMAIEIGHISSAIQINNDLALLESGFGYAVLEDSPRINSGLENLETRRSLAKTAYEPLFNLAAMVQIDYRREKGISKDMSVFSILNGARKNDPTSFSTTSVTPKAQQYYDSN